MATKKATTKEEEIQFIVVDLFAGAGGVTTGMEQARGKNGEKIVKVIAAVNHDPIAIASHAANHPDTLHFIEDIRTLNVMKLAEFVRGCKELYPNARLILWASLECTNHSNAKGGLPRERDSRTLANDLFRYIDALKPDYIMIENVREFMAWGEIDEKGKPISRDKGRDYIRWTNKVQKKGYDFKWRLLNAANYGAHTKRIRYFAIFNRPGLPNSFPDQTHSRDQTGLFNDLEPWRPVKECIDFDHKGKSIFGRKIPLVEKTEKRILAGLEKFVANGDTSYIQKYFSGDPAQMVKSLDEPLGAITTIDHHYITRTEFMYKYYGNGVNLQSIDDACGTITTKDRFGFVEPKFIDYQYGTGGSGSIDKPSGAITTVPKLNLVSAEHFIMNPQYNSKGGSVDSPCFTLIARMDKMPPYLMAVETGELAIKIFKTDTPTMIKIKAFMAAHGIVDILMRGLIVPELKKIMGFPEDYHLEGTQADKKKFIGNAVACVVPQRMLEHLTI